MNKQDIIKDYLSKFPNLPVRTLTNKIYNENPLIWKNSEAIRSRINYYKGSNGSKNLKALKSTQFLSEKKYDEKYNLPSSIEIKYEPYKIIANKTLIFSDVHIPFHNIDALNYMFDFVLKEEIDSIIIDGDLMDCFVLSYYCKDPSVTTFKEEREKTKQFLIQLKVIFPNAKIYYKFGNHEKRFETYLISKAPEIFDNPEFRLEILLDLYNLGINYIPENIYIQLGRLAVLHGHEYVKAVSSPANPARTIFLRAKSNALVGHYHQTSSHTERSIDGSTISTWSIGCLSELHPKYMSLNKWNHGFAIYCREDENFWIIKNKMIVKGKVV